MELVLEMLREAAVRLPWTRWTNHRRRRRDCYWTSCSSSRNSKYVMVIVVSITAVASFIIPNLEMSAGIRLLDSSMMMTASLFGVIGIMVGMAIIIIHILSMESSVFLMVVRFSPLFASGFKRYSYTFTMENIMKKRPLSLNLNKRIDKAI